MGWEGTVRKIDECRWEIPESFQTGAMRKLGLRMRVPALVYADDGLFTVLCQDQALDQVVQVASLPGIVGHSLGMPDIHQGYGFAIGGVAAFDVREGIISPGGVGYDINCGVRLLSTSLTAAEISSRLDELMDAIWALVPAGVGSESRTRYSRPDTDEVLYSGAGWAVGQGQGRPEDLEVTEERGAMQDADPATVSAKAKERGAMQLGTLGAGNHFLEVQQVDEIFAEPAARAFGIFEKGQVMVMLHTGSRGLGHQVCTDYLELMRRAGQKYKIALPDRELSGAPVRSPEGRQYYSAMQCAANYAWANRQMITHQVREAFVKVFQKSERDMGLDVVYDVSHNLARLEEHLVEGAKRILCVHRKGATRALAPGHPLVPARYRDAGQPVIIPGDMGTASYLLAGTEGAAAETFSSACHGAGRMLSRHAAAKQYPADQVLSRMAHLGIRVRAVRRRSLSEEAPGAYKDIDRVVEVTERAGIARKVCRMKPLGVLKG
jgi:tRNA-splicing ligase RtcB